MPLMAAAKPPNKTVNKSTTYHNLTPTISATRVASTLLFGKLLNKAMPSHNNRMAKNGCQNEILTVFPIKPQVAKDKIIITHQGKIICKKKEAIKMTKKTINYFFEIFKCEITLPDLSSCDCMKNKSYNFPCAQVSSMSS